jgi:acetyltransferase-like isoleucine patch superfamily enzyme
LKFLRNLIKKILGLPVYAASRVLKSSLVHQENKRIRRHLGGCGADLDISYPWDIRGVKHVYVGTDVFIGPGVLMIAEPGAEIHIGSKVMLGPQVKLIASDHRFDDPAIPIKDSGYGAFEEIRIGDDVWIGCGTTVLKGVSIGRGSVVGAGAVVTRSIGQNEVWAGNPARKIKDRFSVSAPGHYSK